MNLPVTDEQLYDFVWLVVVIAALALVVLSLRRIN